MLYGIIAALNQMLFFNEPVFGNYSTQFQTPALARPSSTR
jgi:hypothetical protein